MALAELIAFFLDWILHLDTHLTDLLAQYGLWVYAILFIMLFLETGFVLTPFLPGDSLLFAAGAIAAQASVEGFNPATLLILLSLASILGDSVNYAFGHHLGKAIYRKNYKWLNREHLDKTHSFYEKYGGKTIIMARFIPIIRTFAPFVAGAGAMKYRRFLSYNIVGGILWVGLFVFAGYFFGTVEWVKENFTLVIFGIIIASLVPPAVEFTRHHISKGKANAHARR